MLTLDKVHEDLECTDVVLVSLFEILGFLALLGLGAAVGNTLSVVGQVSHI